MLAPAIEIHRLELLQRGGRPVVVEARSRRRRRSPPMRHRSTAPPSPCTSRAGASDERKLSSITRSPSVAVVSEIAPMMDDGVELAAVEPGLTDRPAGRNRRSGAWRDCATCRGAEHVVDGDVGAAGLVEAATTFEPINPAPPVTRSIDASSQVPPRPSIALAGRHRQRGRANMVKPSDPLRSWLRGRWTAQAAKGLTGAVRTQMNSESEHSRNATDGTDQPDPAGALHVDRRFRPLPHRGPAARERWPDRPIDVLTTSLLRTARSTTCRACARASSTTCRAAALRCASSATLAARLRREGYGDALIMPRTWKSALAPVRSPASRRAPASSAKLRFGLLNDCALGREGPAPHGRPLRRAGAAGGAFVARDVAGAASFVVKPADAAAWRARKGLGDGRAVALAPGAVGPSKRWGYFGEAARALAERGLDVWVLGGPGETPLAAEIAATAGRRCATSPATICATPSWRSPSCDAACLERFRPAACRGRDRHADRSASSGRPALALGAAQPARSGRRDQDRRAVPALPQAGVPDAASSLHA